MHSLAGALRSTKRGTALPTAPKRSHRLQSRCLVRTCAKLDKSNVSACSPNPLAKLQCVPEGQHGHFCHVCLYLQTALCMLACCYTPHQACTCFDR